MKSHEVMKNAVSRLGAKRIASEMNLSASLVYKWCQGKTGEDAGGADNPLDRLAKVVALTGDTGPVQWLCRRAGGFFAGNPAGGAEGAGDPLQATQRILRDFSALLNVVSRSIEDDRQIDVVESERIRDVWEQLKTVTETFVRACESGKYAS